MLISLKYYLVPKNTVPSSTLAPPVFTISYTSPTSSFESVISEHSKPAISPSQTIPGSEGKWGGVGGKRVKKFLGHYSHTTFFLHIFVHFSKF